MNVRYYGISEEVGASTGTTEIQMPVSDSTTGYFMVPWKPLIIMIYRGDTSGTDHVRINVINRFGIEKPLVGRLPIPPGINAIEIVFARTVNPAELRNIKSWPAGTTLKIYYENDSGIGKTVSITMGVI